MIYPHIHYLYDFWSDLKIVDVIIIRNIILVLLILSLLPINSVAEKEIDATLEDNVVILLDYSWGQELHRALIKSNIVYAFKNSNVKSNISIITYGGMINKGINLNYSDTMNFIQSISPQSFDAKDNISQAFNETKSILDNATGSKQIILISDGNIDGKNGMIEKLDNVPLIELVKDLKKNNVTINLYQVLDNDLGQKEIMKAYSDLGKGTNTDIVILNQSERLHFVNHEIEKPLIYGQKGEYGNELFGSNETALVIFSMMYQNEEVSFSENYIPIDFYRYCDGYNCIVIPIGRNGKVFDETMGEIFRGKDAIEMVKSGNITDSAYFISNPISELICGYYDSDTFNEESKNLVVEIAPLVKPEFKKPMKIVKGVGLASKPNLLSLIISSECEISTYDSLPEKIIDGGRYTYNLKNGYIYNGIVNDFKNYNDGLIKSINERKNDLGMTLIYIFNAPIYYQPSVERIASNNIQLSKLSNANYSKNVSLAVEQIRKKSGEADDLIGKAERQRNVLDQDLQELQNQKINQDEKYFSKAKQELDEADKYLKNAEDIRIISKFNTAILYMTT